MTISSPRPSGGVLAPAASSPGSPSVQPALRRGPLHNFSSSAPSGVNSLLCWDPYGDTCSCRYQYSLWLGFPFLGMNSRPPRGFTSGLKQSSEYAGCRPWGSLHSQGPRCGFQFSCLLRGGSQLQWFRGALLFGEGKGEDEHLHPAVPARGTHSSCPSPAVPPSGLLCPSPSAPLPTLLGRCLLCRTQGAEQFILLCIIHAQGTCSVPAVLGREDVAVNKTGNTLALMEHIV